MGREGAAEPGRRREREGPRRGRGRAHLNVVELLLSRGADVNGRDHDAVSETMSSVGFPRTDADVMSRIDQLLAHPERMNTTRELVLGSLPESLAQNGGEGSTCGLPRPVWTLSHDGAAVFGKGGRLPAAGAGTCCARSAAGAS